MVIHGLHGMPDRINYLLFVCIVWIGEVGWYTHASKHIQKFSLCVSCGFAGRVGTCLPPYTHEGDSFYGSVLSCHPDSEAQSLLSFLACISLASWSWSSQSVFLSPLPSSPQEWWHCGCPPPHSALWLSTWVGRSYSDHQGCMESAWWGSPDMPDGSDSQFKFWLCCYFMAVFSVTIYCMRNNPTCIHSFPMLPSHFPFYTQRFGRAR